ncbi:hypothetical protein [Candidatus Villigracilis affinis]|uniref:hypothetical protein n=1 Tax=Candidatus Villigracilis affinis TaxID=3140682 RepID=UPI002A2157CB|nr:hypothetical protein [Anaerolineales bacterium]
MKAKQSILAFVLLVLAMLACQTPSLPLQQPAAPSEPGGACCTSEFKHFESRHR